MTTSSSDGSTPPPPSVPIEARNPARAAPAHPHRRSGTRRALIAISAVVVAELVGTIGFHAIEGMTWVNSVYFESMLATGQGPPLALTNDAGKIFASIMAFVSVGSSLSAVLFVLGPMLGRLWRFFVEDVEREARHLEAELR